MKSQSIGLAVLTAIVLASPALTFAGDQPNHIQAVSRTEVQDRTGVSRTINQGKGAGISRQEVAVSAPSPRALRASGSDTAFAK